MLIAFDGSAAHRRRAMRLLVVEDNAELAGLIADGLKRAGFGVDSVEQADDAIAAWRAVSYDAVVLDLGLPDADGSQVLRAGRDSGRTTPVLILTARDAVEDRVAGLNAGADDYLVKPFDMSELVARLRALLRRPGAALGTVLELGNMALDTIGQELQVDGRGVVLARRELALLELLMRRAGHVVPRDLLSESLYAFGEEIASNALEVHVHRLRRKLADVSAAAEIHTVRGVGYIMTDPLNRG
jgi:DNA-binding response OmpR family regulator